jgi:hypothetical protein
MKAKTAKKQMKASNANGIDQPPAIGAPHPPTGFSRPKGSRGSPPTTQQVRDALDVAREIKVATYASDFGKRAPAQDAFASELGLAKAWSDEVGAADAWQLYVHTQRDLAWKAALASAKALKAEFTLADKHDPAIAKRYPQTKAFLGVRSVAAKRAAVTRAGNKKKAASKTP